MHKVLKLVIAIIGTFLVAVLLFDAVQSSNTASYIKSATAFFVTVLLLRSVRKNTKQSQLEIASNKRNIKMIVSGIAIGLGLPIFFIWLVKSAVR